MARRSTIGLDIGTSSLRAAEVVMRPGGAQLTHFGQIALPTGAVREGEVIDTAAVTAALQELWAGAKFSHKRVTVGVANPRVVVRQVEVPFLSHPELRGALPLLVGDQVPIDSAEAVMDFAALEEIRGSDGSRALSGLLVAGVEEMIRKSVDAVMNAGLRVAGVDLSSFGILRSVGTPQGLGLSLHPEAVIDVGADLTNIVVHDNGIPRFVRIMLCGGSTITNELIEELALTLPAAEQLKREIGITDASVLGGQEAAAARVISSRAYAVIEDIRGSLDYFAATSTNGPVTRIVLSGGGAALAGFPEMLAERTHLPVEVGSTLSRLQVGKTGLDPDQLEFLDPVAAVPVGLALGVAP